MRNDFNWVGKRLRAIVLIVAMGMLVSACTRFNTTQRDISYGTNGYPIREITTKATAITFATSKSKLETWKASQSDKTQGASVGSLTQSSNTSNLVDIIGAVSEGAVRGAVKGATK